MLQVPTSTATLSRLHAELRRHGAPPAPALLCPFEPAVHAEVAAIQAASTAWAVDQGLVLGERATARLDASKIGWLVARATPAGERSLVELAAHWTTLFCLLDDHLETLGSPTAVARCLDRILELLRGDRADAGDALGRAAADLGARLARVGDTARRAGFFGSVRRLFDAFVLESELRAAPDVPRLRVYLPVREITVGIHVELELAEMMMDAADPGARAALQPLARRASNIIAWANDVFTFEKEIRAGDPMNVVAVLARERGLGLRDALQHAVIMHDDEVRAFAAEAGEAERRPRLAARVAVLRTWVRGHLDWARETGRYVGAPVAEAWLPAA